MKDCPACGHPSAALVCPACGHDRAPTTCAACLHRNGAERALCEACDEPLGLEPPYVDGPLHCPACGGPLREAATDDGVVRACTPCGGLFLDHRAFASFLQRARVDGSKPPASVRATAPAEVVRYLPCPCCARPMNRKNFGRLSGVIVDVCREHGTFFHLGELGRVLAFVRSGGLVRAERRAAEDARDKEREEAARAHHDRLVEAHRAKYNAIGGTRWSGDDARIIFQSIVELLT